MRTRVLLLAAALAAAVPSGFVFCAEHGPHAEHEHASCDCHGHPDDHAHHRIGDASVAPAGPPALAPPSRAALPGEAAEPGRDRPAPPEARRPVPAVPRDARTVLQV